MKFIRQILSFIARKVDGDNDEDEKRIYQAEFKGSADPKQYNKYNSAQGVSTTIAAIALDPYNSSNTGIIRVKVLNT